MNDYEKLLIKMKKQKHQLRILINKITDYKQEIERLNNIINELEKWLFLEISIHSEDDTIDTLYSCVLDKIKELKGDSSNGQIH